MNRFTALSVRPLIVLVAALVSLQVHAEVEKVALICESQICFHWWPKLPQVPGWHHDRDSSIQMDINAQAPDGETFAKAETVIYAVAPYKPRMPENKNVGMLIERDKKNFRSSTPDISIEETDKLVTGDGQVLRSLTFTPKSKGNWERTSYGEEGDFYLIFTISSRTQNGLRNSMDVYERFVKEYKEHPEKTEDKKTNAKEVRNK